MRFAATLRISRKHHILKDRLKSSLVVLATFITILLVLMLVTNVYTIDTSHILVGFTISLLRTTTAYAISLILAFTIALVITINRSVENVLLPIFDVLQSFPSFALFPLLIHALGTASETIIIAVLTIAMIWPILFSILGGIKNRREDLEEAATVFGASGIKRLRHFTLPELMPTILTGSIVGWGEGWEFIIGAELLVGTNMGIGSYLGSLGNAGKNEQLFIGIVFLMLLLFIINKLIWLPLLNEATQYETEA
jgi:NitT/TauT family transport system permease protein